MQSNPRIDALIKSARVLIVDDEYCIRKLIRTLLLSMGVVDIHDAADGPSGLEAIRTLAPDIVLLDWELRGMDGAEFTRHLRSPNGFVYPKVPIIMLTGHGGRARALEAVRLGVHEFLLKPVSRAALHARLASALSKRRAASRKLAAYKPAAERYNPRVKQVAEQSPA